jgi:hypothetical protein
VWAFPAATGVRALGGGLVARMRRAMASSHWYQLWSAPVAPSNKVRSSGPAAARSASTASWPAVIWPSAPHSHGWPPAFRWPGKSGSWVSADPQVDQAEMVDVELAEVVLYRAAQLARGGPQGGVPPAPGIGPAMVATTRPSG